MIFGRTVGWVLVVLAIIMASAEAVMALVTGAYTGLAAVDVWTLLVGQTPDFVRGADATPLLAAVGAGILSMPAWVVFGVMGFLMLHVCRKRRARRRAFRSA